MSETIVRHRCTVCGTEWDHQELALLCESSVLPPCPVKPGDKVKVYERYDPPEPDEVVSVRVVIYSPALSLRSWGGRYKEALKRFPDLSFHTYLVKVKDHHRMSKDHDSNTDEVYLSDIMVGDDFLPDILL